MTRLMPLVKIPKNSNLFGIGCPYSKISTDLIINTYGMTT